MDELETPVKATEEMPVLESSSVSKSVFRQDVSPVVLTQSPLHQNGFPLPPATIAGHQRAPPHPAPSWEGGRQDLFHLGSFAKLCGELSFHLPGAAALKSDKGLTPRSTTKSERSVVSPRGN